MTHIKNLSRRRFIGIIAATTAMGVTALDARKTAHSLTRTSAQATAASNAIAISDTTSASAFSPIIWRGIALGADAELHIYHPDPQFAHALIAQAVTEVRRLERIFSLHTDTALTLLNRQGHLENAPGDLIRLLQLSQDFSELTQGAFDPSVQPLWQLYADTVVAGKSAPSLDLLQQTLQRIGYRHISLQGNVVRLTRPGMALTLNGIAQGYITDRVTELLRDAGLEHALVDMGEIRGLARNPGNRSWRIGLAGDSEDRTPLHMIDIRNRAVSTSAGAGTILDTSGLVTHIFDPRTGSALPRYRSVSIVAGDATTADAMSTACSLLPEDNIARLADRLNLQAWVLRHGESRLTQVA